MISTHCGKKLFHRSSAITRNNEVLYHRWKCAVCGKSFTQRPRKSKKH